MASIDAMVRQAQERWGRDNVGRIHISQPGDATARVAVSRGEPGRVSMSPQFMEFEGTTGKLVRVRDNFGPAAETRGVLYALHLGRFSDITTRWLYFLVSFMGTAMVGTGLVMWTVKRRQKLKDPARPYFGFRLVERMNVASIAGLSIAMTAFLWANRLAAARRERSRGLGDPHLLHRMGRCAAARAGQARQVRLDRAALGGGGDAVSPAGPQRGFDAASVLAQPDGRRLDIRRHGHHVLGACFASRHAGDTRSPQGHRIAAEAEAKPERFDHRCLRRRSGMMHLLSFVLCLAGFAALALATPRQHREIVGRPLRLSTKYLLRAIGTFALLAALGLLVAWNGWSLGLVMFSGHTSLAAGLLYCSLIGYARYSLSARPKTVR
ncbi:MAG: PepSY-associated TM helix domain-containing protein [Xanthobacteraceae bacterium]